MINVLFANLQKKENLDSSDDPIYIESDDSDDADDANDEIDEQGNNGGCNRSNVFKVEKILSHKMDGPKVIYIVKWHSYSKKQCTYEPHTNFIDFQPIEDYFIGLLNKNKSD